MSPRGTRFALLLTVTLTAIALFAGGQAAQQDIARVDFARAGIASGPFKIGDNPADGVVAQAVELDRRESDTPARTLVHRLVLVAIVASLVVITLAARRREKQALGARSPATASWSMHAGRAPPQLLPSIV
jgi:hypothetical protein